MLRLSKRTFHIATSVTLVFCAIFAVMSHLALTNWHWRNRLDLILAGYPFARVIVPDDHASVPKHFADAGFASVAMVWSSGEYVGYISKQGTFCLAAIAIDDYQRDNDLIARYVCWTGVLLAIKRTTMVIPVLLLIVYTFYAFKSRASGERAQRLSSPSQGQIFEMQESVSATSPRPSGANRDTQDIRED